MVKRGLDVFLSAVLLLVSLPVLLLSALIVGITSPGPVLFRQVRMGRGFRSFEILKFRTMAHAEAGLAYTLGPDPRITPVGKWLRRSKLDELPQLWNVLRGDMSIVGPRPVLPELTEEFRDQYALLLRARPGLTDPASLKYSQEARLVGMVSEWDRMPFFKTVITPDKLRISAQYADQATVWSDLGTIAMTALICCAPSLSRVYGKTPEPGNWRRAASPKVAPGLAPGIAPALAPGIAPGLAASLVSGFVPGFVPGLVPDMNAGRGLGPSSARFETAGNPTQRIAYPLEDSCIFSQGLVEVEAAAEDLSPVPHLPWISLPSLPSGGRSASAGSEGRASRL